MMWEPMRKLFPFLDLKENSLPSTHSYIYLYHHIDISHVFLTEKEEKDNDSQETNQYISE
jgi:hypothetical protein